MVTTKQDGHEDVFESKEVSASKATESRNEVQKVSEGHLPRSTSRRCEQEDTDNTKHGIRSAEGDERIVQSR